MSTPLAIAATTEMIRRVIDSRLQQSDLNLATLLTAPPAITAIPPAHVNVTQNQASSVNIFMYLATYNPGWRNAGLPTRDSRGERLSAPPLPLDLHYLVTAYGNAQLHSDILLGCAMHTLYEYPLLPRQRIRDMLQGSPYAAAELADQIEAIRIAPHPMNTEEMSKLWSAFQTEYRPSAAYQVSVILIDSRTTARTSPPVRERTLTVMPLPNPRLSKVNPISLELPLPAQPDEYLTLTGSSLWVEGATEVHFDDARIDDGTGVPLIQSASDTEIVARVPRTLRAGLHTVRVSRQVSLGIPPTPHIGFGSNPLALVVLPRITGLNIINVGGPDIMRVTLHPGVSDDQRVVLILNTKNPTTPADVRSFTLNAPPRPPGVTTTVDFPIQRQVGAVVEDLVAAGTYLARVSVDGAESLLTTDADGLYAQPEVIFP